MKKDLKTKCALFPMPVLMIATYNEDESVDVMNAAWGMMYDFDQIIVNLDMSHKTAKNILRNKAFTVSLADEKHIKEADYVGIVSANNDKDKFTKSGLSYTPSKRVDAPIINEFPLCMECEFLQESDAGVIGKIVNVSADEGVMSNDSIDIDKLNAIAYDPFTHGYYKVNKRVGNAFKDGLEVKNK